MIPDGFRFAEPWYLLGLVPVVGTGLYLAYRRQRQKEPALTFSAAALVMPLPRTIWSRLTWLPDVLRLLSLAAIVLALARPQAVGVATPEDAEGIDIMVVLDTSCSMKAADFQPRDRMYVAKQSVAQFVKKRSVDRIGLVVFAGEAASWVPLTLDYSLVAQMLDEVETGMLPDGTAIGSAVGTALNRLRESDATSRVIVLLTDGDNNRGSISPKKAADFAKELGVKVYTILIGRGGPVPFPAGKDLFGRPVFQSQVVPTNPKLLEEMAAETGGEAFTATDSDELDERLGDVLDRLDRSRLAGTVYSTPKDELFPDFVWAGLLLMAVEVLLSATRLRRLP